MLQTRRYWLIGTAIVVLSVPCHAQVSLSTQRFVNVYRAAQIEMDWLRCESITCADLKTKILSFGPQFEAGSNLDILYPKLITDVRTLDQTLRHDYPVDYGRAAAIAISAYRQASTLAVQPQDSYAQEQCKQGCDRRMVVVIAVCSIIPPPLDALCVSTAIVAYWQCLANCDQSNNDVAILGLPEAAVKVPLPSASDLNKAIPRLALHYGTSELNAALSAARSILLKSGGVQ